MELMHQLTPQLKRLRLSGILETLEIRNQQAIDEKWSYVEFLSRLVQDEVERRAQKQPWPRTLKEQAQGVRSALATFEGPATVEEVAAAFTGRRTAKRLAQIEEILEMLAALGQAQVEDGERYVVGQPNNPGHVIYLLS